MKWFSYTFPFKSVKVSFVREEFYDRLICLRFLLKSDFIGVFWFDIRPLFQIIRTTGYGI